MTNNQISELSMSIAKIQDENNNNKNMYMSCIAFLSVMVIVMNENFMQYVTDTLNTLVKYPAFYVMGIFMLFLINNITINKQFFKRNYSIDQPIVEQINIRHLEEKLASIAQFIANTIAKPIVADTIIANPIDNPIA